MALIPPLPGGVLVAVSSGADSTALAWRLRRARIGPLHLAHVRHGFRPEAATRELALLRELARRLDATLHVLDAPAPAGWSAGGKIPEAWAREQRYAALVRCAMRLGVRTIATAHHRGDRREAQLLHLLRGGGLRALRGTAGLRELGGCVVWRPLLESDPGRLRAELRAGGQEWLEDATNDDLRLARNRIRHRLLPELLQAGDPFAARLDPIARAAAAALSAIARACDRWLDAAVPSARARCLLLPADRVAPLAPGIVSELVLRAAARLFPGRAQATRGGELRELVRWLRAPAARGRRLCGALALERSRRWLALHDPVRCDGKWRVAQDGAAREDPSARWLPRGAVVAVRPLAEGDGLARYAAALPPVERRAWPAVLVDGRIAWVPQLWSAPVVRSGRADDAVAIAFDGLPDLRLRSPAAL